MGRLRSGDFLPVTATKNLYGKSIEGRHCFLDVKNCQLTKGLSEAYPFLGQTIPVTIKQVCDNFIAVDVDPHTNVTIGMMNFGNSRPYVVTVPKFYLIAGAMVLKDTPTASGLTV